MFILAQTTIVQILPNGWWLCGQYAGVIQNCKPLVSSVFQWDTQEIRQVGTNTECSQSAWLISSSFFKLPPLQTKMMQINFAGQFCFLRNNLKAPLIGPESNGSHEFCFQDNNNGDFYVHDPYSQTEGSMNHTKRCRKMYKHIQ